MISLLSAGMALKTRSWLEWLYALCDVPSDVYQLQSRIEKCLGCWALRRHHICVPS